MIKKHSEIEIKTVEGAKGGKGKLLMEQYFSEAELKNGIKMLSIVTLESGASVGLHKHTDNSEIYLILEGGGVVKDDEYEVRLHAGDTIYTPAGHSHSIENTGEKPLKFLAVIA